jgi:hypothetical protein
VPHLCGPGCSLPFPACRKCSRRITWSPPQIIQPRYRRHSPLSRRMSEGRAVLDSVRAARLMPGAKPATGSRSGAIRRAATQRFCGHSRSFVCTRAQPRRHCRLPPRRPNSPLCLTTTSIPSTVQFVEVARPIVDAWMSTFRQNSGSPVNVDCDIMRKPQPRSDQLNSAHCRNLSMWLKHAGRDVAQACR